MRRLLKETIVYGTALGVRQISTLVLWPVYARIFSISQMGSLSLALAYQSLLMIFTGFALDNSAFRWYWDREDDHYRYQVLSTWFLFQLSTALLGLVLTIPITALLLPSSPSLLLLSAISLVPRSLSMVVANYYRLVRAPQKFFAFNFLQLGGSLGVTLFLVYWLGKPEAVFWGEFVVEALILVIFFSTWGGWLKKGGGSFQLLGPMLRYAVPLALSGLALWLLGRGDRWLVKIVLGLESTGIYQLGGVLSMSVGLPVIAFQQAWGPFALSIFKESKASQTYAKIADGFTITISLWAVVVSLFLPEITLLLFGERYRNALWWVVPLLFAQVFYGQYYIFAIGCNISKENRPIAQSVWLGSVLKLMGGGLLMVWFGLLGMGWAVLLSNLIVAAYLYWRAQRLYYVPYRAYFLFLIPLAFLGMAHGVSRLSLSLYQRIFLALLFFVVISAAGFRYLWHRWYR